MQLGSRSRCVCVYMLMVSQAFGSTLLYKPCHVEEVLWYPIPGIMIMKTSGEHACRRSHVKKVLMKTESGGKTR